MRVSLGMLFVLLAACQTAPARPGVSYPVNAEQEILRAEREWTNALTRLDANAFASYLDDKWVAMNSGLFIEKKTWVDSLRVAKPLNATTELGNLKVRFPRPDVAVVSAHFLTRIKAGTTERATIGAYLNTWAWIGGRWQLVGSSFSTILKSP